ncbi:MAG: zf-HC2 domain-containing protein [Holophagales bacterium]|nr:zf-HC2 domain-containing protein [Holophagales bacterium]
MSQQVSSELLSAYLDGELDPQEAARVERLIEGDVEIRRQLEGMRSIVSNLRHLEHLKPPPTLGQDVARRIALDGERQSLLDRVEARLEGTQLQSNTFLMFSLIIALAVIVLFFAFGLRQWNERGLVPVRMSDDAPEAQPEDMEPEVLDAATVWVAGRLFAKAEDGRWVQEGLSEEEVASARAVDLESAEGRALVAERPDLRGVAMLGHAVVLHGEEVLELRTLPRGTGPEPR